MSNTGDTAWVLASASLVLLMTPGLALDATVHAEQGYELGGMSVG